MNFTLSNTGFFFFFKYIWALCCDAVMYLQLSSIDFWNCFWTVPRLAQCSLFSLELIRHHFCGNTLLWTLRSLPCIGRSHAAGQNPKTLPALCALHFLSHLFLAVLSPLSVSLHTHPDGFLANDSRDPLCRFLHPASLCAPAFSLGPCPVNSPEFWALCSQISETSRCSGFFFLIFMLDILTQQ